MNRLPELNKSTLDALAEPQRGDWPTSMEPRPMQDIDGQLRAVSDEYQRGYKRALDDMRAFLGL